ncbi:MAG: AtpZ/AtpI family protein [Planctomycetota bacterium]
MKQQPTFNEKQVNHSDRDDLEQKIEIKGRRKVAARQEGKRSPWFGLGMFGLIGWSVVLPTIGGIILGGWIDQQWPSNISWRITLLFAGIFMGCLNAWYWIQKETNQ